MQKECECIMFGKLKNLFSQPGITIASPVSGTVVPLTEVPDPTFAQGILGPGAAVQPSEGRIVAPANGTVDMMFDTGHAVSMTTAGGRGAAHPCRHRHRKPQGTSTTPQSASRATPSARAIRSLSSTSTPSSAAGYEVVTPIIVCNPDVFASVKTEGAGGIQAGDTLLTLEKK